MNANNKDQVFKKTGCLKPCYYKYYRMVEPRAKMAGHENDKKGCQIAIWNTSPDTYVKTESLVYPWTSLVAEFGGTLGLFLGFSFMTIWDGLQSLMRWGRQGREYCGV